MTLSAERTISWYAYAITGLALVTVVSPLIVISIPILALMAWPTYQWWRRRSDRRAVPTAALVVMMLVAVALIGGCVGLLIWTAASDNNTSPRDPAIASAVVTLVLAPWIIALTSYIRYLRGIARTS